jgi:flavodoxin
MKTLVLFDSNFGNTKQIADAITQQIGTGAFEKSVNDVKQADLNGIDLLIVGSPINAWRPTKKITAFLNDIRSGKLTGVKAAAFDTRVRSFISGNAAKRISKSMEKSGAEVLVAPIGFYVTGNEGPLVEGEIARAKEWAGSIQSKL